MTIMMEQSAFISQKQKDSNDLYDLAGALECREDPEKAERIFCAILHTLRDNLSLDDAICLLRLLPQPLQIIYIENWQRPAAAIHRLNPHQFIQSVRNYAGKIAFYDFPTEALTARYIRNVFKYIEKDMSKNKKWILNTLLPFSFITLLEPLFQATPFTNIYKGSEN